MIPLLQASGRSLLVGLLVGIACGLASALFLTLLEGATDLRVANESVVWLLPVAGFAIGLFYERFGAPIAGGSNLVLDTTHDGGPRIPLRMAPMVLIGTVSTHLFGGSAGREGTAVQMGASLADALAHRLRASSALRREMLVAGMAGGFGSVFGTPVAGAVFGLEVVAIGRLETRALLAALTASVVGDLTTQATGVGHTHYPSPAALGLGPVVLLKWIVFAVAIAAMVAAFIELTHALKRRGEVWLPRLPHRMAAGGVCVVGLWQLVGTGDFLGLGVPMIVRSFQDPALVEWAFALKLLFTAVTLAAGYLGGEVTPLFLMGAALGNVLARALDLPLELGAGVGMAAAFAAASNTPLALSIMAMELLGATVFPHVVIVCVVAYLLTGHRSIYGAQRVWTGKDGLAHGRPTRVSELAAPESGTGSG